MTPMMGSGAGGVGLLGGRGAVGHGAFAAKAKRSRVAEGYDEEKGMAPRPAPAAAANAPAERSAVKDVGPAGDDARRSRDAVVRMTIVSTTPTDLTSPERPALEALRALPRVLDPAGLLDPRGPSSSCAFHVDASGKVTAVDVVSGDPGLGKLLRARLLGLTSASKAASTRAVLVLTLQVR